VQECLGHANISTTCIYDRRKTRRKIARHLRWRIEQEIAAMSEDDVLDHFALARKAKLKFATNTATEWRMFRGATAWQPLSPDDEHAMARAERPYKDCDE
jgi:hypothetical protein